MHEMQPFAIDDPVACASDSRFVCLSVCQGATICQMAPRCGRYYINVATCCFFNSTYSVVPGSRRFIQSTSFAMNGLMLCRPIRKEVLTVCTLHVRCHISVNVLYLLTFVECAVAPQIDGSEVVDEHSVVLGSALTLSCPASGVPQPLIQWTRHGEAISVVSEPNLRLLDDRRELHLTSAHLLDAGSYTCTAANQAGSASKQFSVNVMGEYFLL